MRIAENNILSDSTSLIVAPKLIAKPEEYRSKVFSGQEMSLVDNPDSFFCEITACRDWLGLREKEYMASPIMSNTISLTIIVLFVFVAERLRVAPKYFRLQLHRLFSVRLRESMFDDHTTINEIFTLLVFSINSCFMQGLAAYLMMTHFGLLSFNSDAPWISPLVCVAVFFACFVMQYSLLWLLGYTFAENDRTKIWLEGFFAAQTILGIALIPAVMLMNIGSGLFGAVAAVALLMFVLLRIVFVIKGIRIFFANISRCVYLILYLCTIEIIPVIITISAIVSICNYFQ